MKHMRFFIKKLGTNFLTLPTGKLLISEIANWYLGNIFFFYFYSQNTFQRRLNVVFRLVSCRDNTQRQINVETTLCTSALKFTTLNNVESTLSISTLI